MITSFTQVTYILDFYGRPNSLGYAYCGQAFDVVGTSSYPCLLSKVGTIIITYLSRYLVTWLPGSCVARDMRRSSCRSIHGSHLHS